MSSAITDSSKFSRFGIATPTPLPGRVVGERHLTLELDLQALRLNAIHFGGWDGIPPAARVRIAYRLEPDDYRGGGAIQLVVVRREHGIAGMS